ncbi:hypothetical protein EON67_07610 [archaeon]|nr:MAG: hypothetical protein EON67_07610 [archaeon]
MPGAGAGGGGRTKGGAGKSAWPKPGSSAAMRAGFKRSAGLTGDAPTSSGSGVGHSATDMCVERGDTAERGATPDAADAASAARAAVAGTKRRAVTLASVTGAPVLSAPRDAPGTLAALWKTKAKPQGAVLREDEEALAMERAIALSLTEVHAASPPAEMPTSGMDEDVLLVDEDAPAEAAAAVSPAGADVMCSSDDDASAAAGVATEEDAEPAGTTLMHMRFAIPTADSSGSVTPAAYSSADGGAGMEAWLSDLERSRCLPALVLLDPSKAHSTMVAGFSTPSLWRRTMLKDALSLTQSAYEIVWVPRAPLLTAAEREEAKYIVQRHICE